MAHRYTSVKVKISEGQKEKIKSALQSGDGVSIRLKHEDIVGEDVIGLTQSQIFKLSKAYEAGKGITIKMSKAQIAHNMKIEGGFLPLLAGLAAKFLPILTGTILPALATGALSGLASTGVSKIMGNGMFLKRGGCCCQVETDGKGLYLTPYSGKGLESVGEGVYIQKGNKLYDGRGLLFGPNSPFSSIPILGAIF